MEELLKEIRQYRKEQAELFEWTKKNGHPKMASFDEGGLNACDKIIAIVERALAKSSDESSNCNMPRVSGSCGSEMLERLINSHFSLFRRLNQINNKEPQSEATQKSLEEAIEVNRYFADKDSAKIVQS